MSDYFMDHGWVLLGCIIGVIFLIGIGVNQFVRASCLQSYENYQPQYGFISGCRIVVYGVLTPTDIVVKLNK
jgi:hypothetical protein